MKTPMTTSKIANNRFNIVYLQEYRTFRASLFVGLGLTSASPIIHLINVHGLDYVIEKGALYNALIMGALYITGACLYAARIPERFMPGKCDIWFQSHQQKQPQKKYPN